ncbi:MAG: hypothetical protein EKK37_12930 [Sphingobacteriales bacterium]|nr:MAG: hypothetical protein EKK37_12930 [Sphingobacteriales bacterium]
MQTKLQSIILFCADVEKLTNFYISNFGLTMEGEADKNWTVLNTGTIQLAFHKIREQYLTVPPDQFRIEDSNVKLVFETDSNLEQLRENLLSRNITIGEVKQFPGYPYAVCDGNDPEGNVFQIKQKLQ